MKKIRRKLNWGLFLLCLNALWMSSCYEPSEGCLDVTATNFAADADDQCPDCCTYPLLNLSFIHNMGDTTFTPGDNYACPMNPDQYFKLISAQFYLSELRLVKPDGSSEGVNDRISLTVLDDTNQDQTISVEDNYNLLTRTTFSLQVGDFRAPAQYDSLRFYVGVPDPVNSTDPDLVTANHPLQADSTMHWNRTDGYVFMNIQLTRDTLANSDTLNLKIGGMDNLVQVNLENIQTVDPGFDANITMEIDYLEWFKGINFATDTEAEMINKIVTNASNAFMIPE